MSSSDRDQAIEPLPPTVSSMWRLCKLGYRHEPRLMLASLALSQLAALPDALLALWLIAVGAFPLLGVTNPTLNTVLHVTAIAAGVLLLWNR